MKYYSVYILRLANGDYYVGKSNNLRKRLNDHMSGFERTTKKFMPLELVTFINFTKKQLA